MTQTDEDFFKARRPRAEFPTTHWSVVLTANDPVAPQAGEALEKLCGTYWHPVYAYIRRQTPNSEDARDLTQEFFARFLAKEQFKRADSKRGRLRSYLLISIKNFLTNEWAYAQRPKRGGGRGLLSLEESLETEAQLLVHIADPATPPDRAYEKQWAFALLDHALAVLRQQILTPDGLEQFDALKVFVWGNPTNPVAPRNRRPVAHESERAVGGRPPAAPPLRRIGAGSCRADGGQSGRDRR